MNRSENFTALCLGLSAVLLLCIQGSALADLTTGDEIRECARGNFPERTSIQFIELKTRDRAGREKLMDARLHWRRDDAGQVRLMIRVDGPQDIKGSAYLVIENKPRDTVYMYLPSLVRPRRVVGGGGSSIWGTDFSHEDLRLLQMRSDALGSVRLADAEVADREVYVVEQAAEPDSESAYGRIVSYFDKQTCVALQTEYFDAADRLHKRLTVDPATVAQVNGRWTAYDLEMSDVGEETSSWIHVKHISLDEDISRRFFNTVQFYKD
ncbi:MAG: outer membrane lipoprotein-sorting protein [Gammaproteobacteria bacterium]